MFRAFLVNDRNIADFCNFTYDNNDFHNSDFMRNSGLLPVVPGLYVATYLLSMCSEYLETSDKAVFHFGNPFFSGDTIKLKADNQGEFSGLKLFATNQFDEEGLIDKTDFSSLYFMNAPTKPLIGLDLSDNTGFYRNNVSVGIDMNNLKAYGELIGLNENADAEKRNFLYLSCLVSSALFTAIGTGTAVVEKELSEKLQNGYIPIYKQVSISAQNGFIANFNVEDETGHLNNSLNSLNFDILEKAGLSNSYSFNVLCFCNNKPIYDSCLLIDAVPKRIIERALKGQVKRRQS